MSSWLSQSTEILLSQQTYCPDAPHCSAAALVSQPLSKYKIIRSYNTTFNDYSKWIKASNLTLSALSGNETNRTSSFSYKVATAKEKILHFGASILSQLPKKAETTTSSLWNLFSNQEYKASIKNLFHQMQRFETHFDKTTELKYTDRLIKKEETSPKLYLNHKNRFAHTQKQFSSHSTSALWTSRSYTNKSSYQALLFKKEEYDQNQKQKVHVAGKQQSSHQDHHSQQHQNPHALPNKYQQNASPKHIIPTLIPPTIGIFSLGYLLTKQGILSDFAAYTIYKDNLEASQREMDACHEERIHLIKQAIKKESHMSAWNAFTRILEWAATWINLGITTAAVISSGGILAIGALVASIIVLIINIIDELDGWKTIVKLLPGKNKERKSKLLNFVKYALFIISALISTSVIYSDNIPGSSIMQGAIVAIPPALEGFIALLRGIIISLQSRLFKIKESYLEVETKIDIHNWERNDYLSRAEELLTNLENNFEQLARILHLHYETTQQSIHCLK